MKIVINDNLLEEIINLRRGNVPSEEVCDEAVTSMVDGLLQWAITEMKKVLSEKRKTEEERKLLRKLSKRIGEFNSKIQLSGRDNENCSNK